MARQFAELENLYDTTPVGLALLDTEYRWVRINESLAAINGFPVKEHIGKSQRDLLPEIADEVEAALQQVIDTRKPLLGLEIAGQTAAEPGVTRNWIADYYPVLSGDEVFAVGACVREVTDQKRLTAELAESEARMKRLFDASPVFIAITEGPDHVYAYSNPPHDAICGHRELIGKPIIEALPDLAGQGVVERFDEVFLSGERMVIPEFKAVFDMNGDGKSEEAWFTQTLEPIRDGQGRVTGVATFAYDITESVTARDQARQSEEQKTLLMGELQHRVKNTLATVSAISKLLLKDGDSARDYQERLTQRLQSISRTHDVLTDVEWSSVTLDQIVSAELAPYSGGGSRRFDRHGPDLSLESSKALSLGMAIHELATNAAKYGALSTEHGRVIITSRLDDRDADRPIAEIEWKETGGPKIEKEPTRDGFGSLVFEKVLTRDLDAQVDINFSSNGLRFKMTFEHRE